MCHIKQATNVKSTGLDAQFPKYCIINSKIRADTFHATCDMVIMNLGAENFP